MFCNKNVTIYANGLGFYETGVATDILLALGYGLLFFLEPLPIAKFGLVPFLGGLTHSSDPTSTAYFPLVNPFFIFFHFF